MVPMDHPFHLHLHLFALSECSVLSTVSKRGRMILPLIQIISSLQLIDPLEGAPAIGTTEPPVGNSTRYISTFA
jgi:hypothetical protein